MTESGNPSAKTPTVLVGPAGWSYPDWEGAVYPRPHPKGFHPLPFLARYVDMVELNSSFYAMPSARNAARWVDLLEPHPRFCLTAKLHQRFTHDPWTQAPETDAGVFRDGLRPLVEADRLAALLAQFPVSFREGTPGWEKLARLRELFSDQTLVVELRHRSWFEPEALARLERLGLALAWLDLPAASDHPPAGHETPGIIGYARLHGRNARAWFDKNAGRDDRYDWLYGRRDLEQIAARVRELASGGRRTYLVTNNHYGGKAIANALELKGLLTGEEVEVPPPLVRTYPRLAELEQESH